MKIDNLDLVRKSIEARSLAYAPYSNFLVGAALLGADGQVFLGANIENAAFTPGICAERSAFAVAITSGVMQFSAIAVAGWQQGKDSGQAFPCGVCRQFMVEFCKGDFVVLIAQGGDNYTTHTLGELLPHSFGPDDL
ncbi:MAG: cytidine deaminase [Defluviitaleaceae bacterium]|nr:cytidine deaminase [Defluviitaleaceae bacterium]